MPSFSRRLLLSALTARPAIDLGPSAGCAGILPWRRRHRALHDQLTAGVDDDHHVGTGIVGGHLRGEIIHDPVSRDKALARAMVGGPLARRPDVPGTGWGGI